MNRRKFFTRLGLGTAITVVAPKIIASEVEPIDFDITNNRIIRGGMPLVHYVDREGVYYGYKEGEYVFDDGKVYQVQATCNSEVITKRLISDDEQKKLLY